MGIYAVYMAVSDDDLEKMMELEEDDLSEYIEELEDEGKNDIYNLDKLWDGLHFLLTGKSSETPIEDDSLSEFVVGIHVFDVEETFISCTETEEIENMISDLEKIDMDTLCRNADMSKFRNEKIYPNIWADEKKDELMNELKKEFLGLLEFYRSALKSKMNVVVSIC